jgi:tRNA(fMet)-specific endonuclease VapC
LSRFCLDTSAYSNFKRGHRAAADLIGSASWIGLPVIVLGELRTGFALGRNVEQNERELHEFIRNAVVSVLDVNNEVSRLYAEIVSGLRRAGTPVPTNDIWIAALAAREGAPILTFDAHFGHVARTGARILR